MTSLPRSLDRPEDAGDRNRTGAVYFQRLYSCATATKASIKTVEFTFNGTGTFEDLIVKTIKNKIYPAVEQKPIWGVEVSGQTFGSSNPLWGIVDPSLHNSPNVSTIQQDHLWLPGFSGGRPDLVSARENLPGNYFYRGLGFLIYQNMRFGAINPTNDYTGEQNYAMHMKWWELTANSSAAGKILDLIWTDLAMNSLIGTRGWMNSNSVARFAGNQTGSLGSSMTVPVFFYSRRLQYRYVYMIPAIVLLVSFAILVLTVIILMVVGKTGIGNMNQFLDQISLGRNLTALLYPDVASQALDRSTWIELYGRKLVTLFVDLPAAPGGNIGHSSMTHSERHSLVADENKDVIAET
jgi:hypothetical protein